MTSMDSLVFWKAKPDKYRDETDSDDTEVREPKLTDTLQECSFVMRDETNAKAVRRLKNKGKQWW